jgi:hypothetical protein
LSYARSGRTDPAADTGSVPSPARILIPEPPTPRTADAPNRRRPEPPTPRTADAPNRRRPEPPTPRTADAPTSPTAYGAITIRPIPPPAIVIPLPAVFVAVTIGVTTPSRGWLPLNDRT